MDMTRHGSLALPQVISTRKASFRTTIHMLSLSRLERSYRSWLLFAAAVHEYAELSGFSQKRAHYGMLKSALRKWNRLVRKQSFFWKPHDAFIYNKLTYLRMQRGLARWRSYLWLVVKYRYERQPGSKPMSTLFKEIFVAFRSEMQRKAIVEHVQDSMARIREHAVTREEHVAELLRDNANLRSNAATMQDTLNRCDKQLSQLAGKRDPAVAVSWCATEACHKTSLAFTFMKEYPVLTVQNLFSLFATTSPMPRVIHVLASQVR